MVHMHSSFKIPTTKTLVKRQHSYLHAKCRSLRRIFQKHLGSLESSSIVNYDNLRDASHNLICTARHSKYLNYLNVRRTLTSQQVEYLTKWF